MYELWMKDWVVNIQGTLEHLLSSVAGIREHKNRHHTSRTFVRLLRTFPRFLADLRWRKYLDFQLPRVHIPALRVA